MCSQISRGNEDMALDSIPILVLSTVRPGASKLVRIGVQDFIALGFGKYRVSNLRALNRKRGYCKGLSSPSKFHICTDSRFGKVNSILMTSTISVLLKLASKPWRDSGRDWIHCELSTCGVPKNGIKMIAFGQ